MIKDAPEYYEGPYRGKAAMAYETCPRCGRPRPTYADAGGVRKYKRHGNPAGGLCGLSRQPVR